MSDGHVSDAQLFALLENVPAGILVIDTGGKVVYINAAWRQVFGDEAATRITGAPIVDAYEVYVAGTQERYPRERSPIVRALAGERARETDIEVRLPGNTRILDIAASPIYGSDGTVAYAIANLVDITSRIRAEEEFRALFEEAPIGIYRTTPAGDLVLANSALFSMLGYQSFDELAKAGGLNAVDDREVFRSMLEKQGHIRALEATWRRRDGSFVNVSENARIVLGTDRRIEYFDGTVEDITPRKEIEKELRRGREQYRHLIENATDIIYRVDTQGIFRYVNPTVGKILGFADEEIIGKHFTDLIEAEYRPAAMQFYRDQFRSKEANTYYEFPVTTKNGHRVWIGQNVQPVLTGEWVLGFQAVARDISQRKEMEYALARARDAALESARVKSEFLANMSHEIRTPLNGVVGMSDLLLRMTLSTEQRDAAQTIRASAEALLLLVDDILDLSKMEAGKLTIAAGEFDLDELVDSVTDIFAERAAAKGLKLRAIIYPEVHRHLVGDAMRLRQVLINLVGNAIKFTETGEVNLSVMMEDSSQFPGPAPPRADRPENSCTLWFLVNDTGIGISEGDQARLFAPFVQADGTTTRRFGGTGLGLAISKQLVDMMGGRMGVASVPGEGSTFWFTAEFQSDVQPDAERQKTALAGVRVMLVDSDEMNRLMLRRHLTSSSMIVHEVPPDRVVAALRGDPFDVVVVEMQLDDTDGISVVREIHADEKVGTTPVVLVTAIGRRQSDIDFFRAERIDTWVMKPVRRAHLAAAVAQVILPREVVATTEPAPATTETTKVGARILIVEDNVINQKVADGQLRLLGYEPEIIGSGSAAIEAVRRSHYDLILLDCQMPEMDGYEVAMAIRRMENDARRVPIVAMTAHTAEGEREKCVAAGMDDFVTKPVSTQRLGSLLAHWLGRREADVVDSGKVAGLQLLARANPTFMRDITGLFREDALMRLHELRDAVAAGNADLLMRASHALKSSSGNIGAQRMYAICAILEGNAKKGELGGAGEMVEQLGKELDRALDALTASAGSTGA